MSDQELKIYKKRSGIFSILHPDISKPELAQVLMI
jgi:hypothetical protein